MNNDSKETEIDLLELLFAIRKKIWLVLVLGIGAALIAGLFTKFFIAPKYSSTSQLYILSTSTSLTSLADIQIGSSLTKDYVQLVQSRPVVEQVIKNLDLKITYDELLKQMTFSNPSDTRILVITAVDENPELAKDLVDQFALVSRVQIASIMNTEAPSVVELGIVNDKPVSPSLVKNVVIGGAAGGLLSILIIFIEFMLDDAVKTAEDVEKYLQLNTLASIPLRAGTTKEKKRRYTHRYVSHGGHTTNTGKEKK